MSLLVVGTIGFDTIETPHGTVERVLGGSGVYASYAAAQWTTPRLIGVVGDDFTPAARDVLTARGVCLEGVQVRAGCRTQYWRGRYHPNLHARDHLEVDIDILEGYTPVVPRDFRNSEYVLLAHMPPHLQVEVLDQLRGPRLIVADTIDHWILTRRDELLWLLLRVDGLSLNDQEARLLTGEDNLLRAARKICQLGPKFVIVKKGEHGVILHTDDSFFTLPAYPTEVVIDPTGAGDSFAGGMLGYLNHTGDSGPSALVRAIAHGIVMASFTVEGFGLDRLARVTRPELLDRQSRYREMLKL